MRFLYYGFLTLCSIGLVLAIVGVAGAVIALGYYEQDLPEHKQLASYEPPVVTRVHAGDGRLLAEFSQEKRIFIPITEIPERVKNAFISAEDKNFYKHGGVDFSGVARAMIKNFKNLGTGRRPEGASTITQQVAKNFLLTSEVSYERKIKEALLAFRMERALSKDRLLELYLNQIYLGGGAYGVAAAALKYFDKPLETLTIEEVAYLAALPKAPNNYKISKNYQAALERRNWVIGRMVADGHITKSEGDISQVKPLVEVEKRQTNSISAAFFAEEVRRELAKEYGEDVLYGGGLSVRTSVDPNLQEIAARTLRDGLIAYDIRQGYRGPITKVESLANWQDELSNVEAPEGMIDRWELAVILEDAKFYGLSDGSKGTITDGAHSWVARSDYGTLKDGEVVIVEKRLEGKNKDVETYRLRQVPKVQGALIAMDPHTGRVLAMQGGWSFDTTKFNRVTQAKRQAGSAFKPFVYLAALDNGFTPATLVLDAPFVIDQGAGQGKWRPQNYSREYYGPTPIRVGVEKSRNLMTVRLAEYLGMEKIEDYAVKFGIHDDIPPYLSYALGAGETTLLKLATGYAKLVNGGKSITPTMIDRIQDRYGETIFVHNDRPCPNCGDRIRWNPSLEVPEVPDTREQIADPRRTYQVVSMMEGVVQRGTGIRIRSLGVPIAGKTGTTNESKDTWFIGFTPDLLVGVFVGHDEPKSLGKKETGSSVAVPIFKDFMEAALKDVPPVPFRVPPGLRQVQINAKNGTRAKPGDEKVIWENFIAGREPTEDVYILDGSGISILPATGVFSEGLGGTTSPLTGTGGLY